MCARMTWRHVYGTTKQNVHAAYHVQEDDKEPSCTDKPGLDRRISNCVNHMAIVAHSPKFLPNTILPFLRPLPYQQQHISPGWNFSTNEYLSNILPLYCVGFEAEAS
jgi:hypothetical protein